MKNIIIKRLLAVTLGAVLTVGTLAGCGSTKEVTSDTQTKEEVTEKTESSEEASNDASEPAVEKKKVYAATGASPRPFSYYGDNEELVGHNIELVNAIFEKLPQYELVWEATDFPSIFAGLDSDKYQLGVNNFGKNAEREEKYIFTDPIFANALIVITNKNIELGEVTDYSDLAGLTFIGQAGINQTTLVENYNEANPDAQINIEYTEADLNVQLEQVASGAVDFTTMDAPMYFGYYQPEFNYDLNTSDLLGHTSADGLFSYLLVSKGNEQLAEDINKAFYEVVKEGTSKEICEKYFFSDYSPALTDLTQPK